jgi:hypothetical protein
MMVYTEKNTTSLAFIHDEIEISSTSVGIRCKFNHTLN